MVVSDQTDGLLEQVVEKVAAPLGKITDLDSAYAKLQMVVGVIAISLCPVVIAADHIFGDPDGLRSSVSAYYYGRGGNWFVGGLIAMGVFFLTYEYKTREPDRRVDNVQSTFAGLCAAVVALAPTSSDSRNASGSELIVHYVHTVAAALLFASLAVFSLFHFTKTQGETALRLSFKGHLLRAFRTDWDALAALPVDKRPPPPTDQKKARNLVYRICGLIIVVALVLAVLTAFVDLGSLFLWAEVVAVTAFGISWLVKGGAVKVLNDPSG